MTSREANADLLAEITALRERMASLTRENTELQEQQTATSEILKVISQSPTDVQPVFDAVAESAARLCEAFDAAIFLRNGDHLGLVAHHGPIAIQATLPLVRGTSNGRAVLDVQTVHIADMQIEADEFPEGSRNARRMGHRTVLAVPLTRDGVAIGTINVRRTEAQRFTERQVALLETFADQAVIAIENVRLFKELEEKNHALTGAHSQVTEALAQQTASAEILRVISQSPTDVQPVFDTIIRNAVQLCGARLGAFFRFDGEQLHLVANYGHSLESLAVVRRAYPMRPDRTQAAGRSILARAVTAIPDAREDPAYDHEMALAMDWRSVLAVPLLHGSGSPIGVIIIQRREAGHFAPGHVELLQTFADQAVIAIENVRLFTELQEKNEALTHAHERVTEALDQKIATAEILRVISSSPTDVQPVFDAIVGSAARLCDAEFSAVARFDDDGLLHLVALNSMSLTESEAWHELFPRVPQRSFVMGRAFIDGRVVHVEDVFVDPEYDLRTQDKILRLTRYRTFLGIPILREGVPLGVIGCGRRDINAFTPTQIDLVKTFADQAVIAIENVRLFKELQTSNRELTTALDTQTATSDILRVISQSQTDVQPVFDAIVTSAVRLLQGHSGALTRVVGIQIELAALTSTDDAGDAAVRSIFPHPVHSASLYAQAMRDHVTLNLGDFESDRRLPELARAAARSRGFRSWVVVPMLHHGEAVGTISVTRREPGGFTEDEVALLQTFADQAVIAIENVRLFKELETRNAALSETLEEQTATSEVLKVISRSAFDLQPVLETLVENATRLCGADRGFIFRLDGDVYRLAVAQGGSPEFVEFVQDNPIQVGQTTIVGRTALERRAIHIPDILQDPEYRWSESQERGRFRTLLGVPMLREGNPIGVIAIWREEVRPFSDKQIELVTTFADQAVIAIENVRLFTELQASNRDLTSALDKQTATADILAVISRSQTDVQPVFDAIVTSAVRLLGLHSSSVTRVIGDKLELAALTSTGAEGDASLRATFPISLDSGVNQHARVVRERVSFNFTDAQNDPMLHENVRSIARARGYRSLAQVPMLRRDEAIGAIGVTRREAGGFSDDEIALLKTFADQAVIAIENARLLTELQTRTEELTRSVEQLTALGDVGQAISSTLDLQTVLSTIVARATQLSGTDAGVIYEYDEQREVFVPRATGHLEAEIVETMLATPVRKGEGATGRLAEGQEPIQVPDILAAPAESRVRGALVRAGYRALLAVPLVREGHLIGGLTVIRKSTGEFEADIVELLKTFATQSALAIQNARLFREIEQKSRELEAASRHKSEFLANMSHELRTPLNAIIGFSEVLSDRMFGELNEKQEEYLKDIYASGTHLLSLINDILDLSKIEAGRMELELSDFHLPTALDNALTLVRERAGRRSITLQTSIDDRLGQMQGDERKIRQVVLNLLSNAIKFTPEGGRIEITAVSKDRSVEVSVSDTGVGIALEDQEKVFEEFRQVGTAEKKAEGTGLGLTLCRKFIELHGGTIWVKSKLGAGSTFTFTVPVRRG